MVYRWFGNPKILMSTPLMLLLLFAVGCGTAAPAIPVPEAPAPVAPVASQPPKDAAATGPTPTPPFGAARLRSTPTPTPVGQIPIGEVVVDRLIMVLDPPTRQSTMDCGVTGSATNQHRPSAEYLIHPSRFTGELEPMLATKWSMSEDARTWNFKLRKRVPWHFGFGEFTAADVANSLNYYINEGCKASYSDYFRNNPDADVEIINEYEVNFHMRVRPEVLFDHWVGFRGLPMTSKAQWDSGCPNGVADYQPGPAGEVGYCAAGEAAVEAQPARTGAYQFVNFEKGVSWLYERVPYDHYRVTPDFKELELKLVKEPATRLAIMLAREAHMAVINRSLLQEALDDGLEVVNSQIAGVTPLIAFGGLYFDSSLADKYDPTVPWAAPGEQGRKVRMAMNKALDRDQITNAIFAGLGEKTYVSALHAAFKGGYNSKWDESWEELYGYDPERARELLVEAGYPEGFEVPIKVFTMTGVPEMPDYLEAAAGMWQSIGLEPKLEELEFARWREKYRAAETNCCVYGFRGSALPTAIRVHFAYSPERFMRFYVSDSVTEKRNRALNSTDLEASDVLWAEITDELFYSISGMPLPALPAQATIDPEVVAEYVFLGPNGGFFVYLDYVKAVRQ